MYRKLLKKKPTFHNKFVGNNKAFTLAEVLITLVIIGVIAAITVPSIMQNTERQEFVQKLKKANSVIAQALNRISIETGLNDGSYEYASDDSFFGLFFSNLNVVKNCSSDKDGCFTKETYKLSGTVHNNTNIFNIITADGVAYGWQNDCGTNKGLSAEDEKNCLGRFIVDVNAHRKPNRFGRDIFFFVIVKNKGLVPAGNGDNSADCYSKGNGVTCAAKVLKEGKMNY